MAYRGPDGDGFFDSDRIALGHRRLAIIDRAGGAQPMANEDGSCWIVFNGEVYNHRDLRPVLESRGHVFRTHSDTETILHAWEEYGTDCVERLEGMFTFAIADTRRDELFIARDRLGKKPLFYTMLNGVVHFASELGALAKAPGWRGDLQLDAIEGYLSLGYFLSPDSIYRGVYKLPPGHWLHVAGGRARDAALLGRHGIRHRSARRVAAGGCDRRCAWHGGSRPSRKRSAAGRLSLGRSGLGSCRVVHGRCARRAAAHQHGRLRRVGAQRARRRPPDGGVIPHGAP